MTERPQRGHNGPCEHCKAPEANQHSLRQAGICDGVRNGYLRIDKHGKVTKLESRTS